MKIKEYLTVAIFGLLALSCNIIDNLLTFSINNETSVTIPAGIPVNIPFELSRDTPSNSSTVLENNNTKAELVKDVRLKEMKLTITDPTDKSFSFLKSIHMYISSSDGSDEIELAFFDDINSTSNIINLTCTPEKLDKYIKASSFKLRVKVVTKETNTQNVTIKTNMKFQVTADPF
ncbi:hypothetical protein ACM55G_09875 [Flavobacterium sp. LB3P122]|uniref:hypothetical protein n=1 Tax=Flavobacterium algoriphilum TaxID=3398738 RepID=UPI003A888301